MEKVKTRFEERIEPIRDIHEKLEVKLPEFFVELSIGRKTLSETLREYACEDVFKSLDRIEAYGIKACNSAGLKPQVWRDVKNKILLKIIEESINGSTGMMMLSDKSLLDNYIYPAMDVKSEDVVEAGLFGSIKAYLFK
jgi:hypothetical protein